MLQKFFRILPIDAMVTGASDTTESSEAWVGRIFKCILFQSIPQW